LPYDRILDKALFVQSDENVPAMTFPSPPIIVYRQPQQPQNSVVYAIRTDILVFSLTGH
jgi:hypothetical protein